MEEIRNSILYGSLQIDIAEKLTLQEHLEIVRAVVANPASIKRIRLPSDFHPWAKMLIDNFLL
jgi:hypothetical protein